MKFEERYVPLTRIRYSENSTQTHIKQHTNTFKTKNIHVHSIANFSHAILGINSQQFV